MLNSNCKPIEEGISSKIFEYHAWRLRILAIEPAPLERREELPKKGRKERLSRAAEKRNKYK